MDSGERTTEETVIQLGPVLKTPAQLVTYLASHLLGVGGGQYHLLCLDERGRLLHHWRLPDAGQDERTYRLLLSGALAVKGTAACVLAHGHANRSPVPTVVERGLRKRLRRALEDAGLVLRDHIVFAPSSLWSFQKGRPVPLGSHVRAVAQHEPTSTPC